MADNTGGYPFNPATGEDWPVEVYEQKIAELETENKQLRAQLASTEQVWQERYNAFEDLETHVKLLKAVLEELSVSLENFPDGINKKETE